MLSKIFMKIASFTGFILCKYRGNQFVETITQCTYIFHRFLNNKNFDMKSNGELRVLKILAQSDPKCVFDVGANIGEWSQLMSKICPTCTIHAFEIVPSTYAQLLENIKDLQNVVPNNIGLSSEKGAITMNLGKFSTSSTGFKVEGMRTHDKYYDQEIECETIKASEYLLEKNIESIDLLKIDVEGMDFRVMKGFGWKLKKARVIQFEYGIFNISSHDLLCDFCNILKHHGFIIGKIFPRYVHFFQYNWRMENFDGSNYLAVRKNEKDLIRKLSDKKTKV